MGKLVRTADLKPHPDLNDGHMIPPLEEVEYESLRESIREFGIKQDIVVDLPTMTIIDGHHRWKVAQELGIEEVSVWPEHALGADKVLDLGVELNASRRQWTGEKKRAAIAARLKKNPERSDRSVARLYGVSPTTVGTVRSDLEEAGVVSKLDTRVGTDGVEQPARKPPIPKLPDATPSQGPRERSGAEPPRSGRPADMEPEPRTKPTGKAPQYDKLASMRAAREATVVPIDRAKREPATEQEWVEDETRKAKREVEESSWGRITSWLMRLPLPDKWTDEQVREAVAKDIPNGCMTSARIVHAVLGRIINETEREESSATA